MPNLSDPHLNGAMDPFNEGNYDSSGKSSEMGDSLDLLAQMVKAFLATRDTRSNGRADVVFDNISVEGSGTGVRNSYKRCR